MDNNVFNFSNYKHYLLHKVGPSRQRRGIKSAMARALQCQPTYISHILHQDAHLSLEQADKLNQFFAHAKDEAQYFILLVQFERAGTHSLKNYFQEQMDQMLRRRMSVKERLGSAQSFSKEDQARYYSTWHYSAVHIAVTVPKLQTPQALADFFKISIKKVSDVLEFLIAANLVMINKSGRYQVTQNTVRLGNDSPNIFRHHANWRQQAVESLDREDIGDLHYSGVISLSTKDALRLKDLWLSRIKEDLESVKHSPEEEVFSYCLDLFKLRR